MKVVLDTNVLVSGIFFSGSPAGILRAWSQGKFQLVLSPEILDEYKSVSAELAVKYPGIDIQRILDLIVVHSAMCSPAALPQRLSGRFCSNSASVRRTLSSWMIRPSGKLPEGRAK
jgi:hypothetical protein